MGGKGSQGGQGGAQSGGLPQSPTISHLHGDSQGPSPPPRMQTSPRSPSFPHAPEEGARSQAPHRQGCWSLEAPRIPYPALFVQEGTLRPREVKDISQAPQT